MEDYNTKAVEAADKTIEKYEGFLKTVRDFSFDFSQRDCDFCDLFVDPVKGCGVCPVKEFLDRRCLNYTEDVYEAIWNLKDALGEILDKSKAIREEYAVTENGTE